ncbi:30S ribosomal protein S1, chloroplastic [Tetrabaena socialis]|uniref:30S ribosomal protein S1, chloroplastic n=1 Tax=Tetrabaena socialis TaxID=47790 RepID=A0A2J7ZHF6_9CHLO|nr:30S ribosomal protein S1, chloroplastic [Tetrabaena socialis]|eukprot:PNG99694.1 30S ribosomal protein S1, chloroplastic [Tetrabaena socialis]
MRAKVDIGDGAIGEIPLNQVSRERIEAVDAHLKVGDKVKALVINHHPNYRGHAKLSTKLLEPTPGDMLRNPQLVYEKAEETAELRSTSRNTGWEEWVSSRNPSVGDDIEGVVTTVTRFGAFINLGNFDGMLPRQEVSHTRGALEQLKVGDKLKLRIMSMDPKRGRVALSAKALEPEPTPGEASPGAALPEA